jgi:hypothetical protein
MIFTNSNATANNSVRLTQEHIAMLGDRTKVDDVFTFTECGYFCIQAFKGKEQVFYAHSGSQKEFIQMRDQRTAYGY